MSAVWQNAYCYWSTSAAGSGIRVDAVPTASQARASRSPGKRVRGALAIARCPAGSPIRSMRGPGPAIDASQTPEHPRRPAGSAVGTVHRSGACDSCQARWRRRAFQWIQPGRPWMKALFLREGGDEPGSVARIVGGLGARPVDFGRHVAADARRRNRDADERCSRA